LSVYKNCKLKFTHSYSQTKHNTNCTINSHAQDTTALQPLVFFNTMLRKLQLIIGLTSTFISTANSIQQQQLAVGTIVKV